MDLIVAFPGNKPIERENEIIMIRTDQMTIYGSQEDKPTPLNLILAGLGLCRESGSGS